MKLLKPSQPLAGTEGTTEEILIHAKEFLRTKDTLNHLLAKHTGEFAGIPPKGNQIRCPAISTFRIEGGLLAEAWEIFDSGDLMRQLQA